MTRAHYYDLVDIFGADQLPRKKQFIQVQRIIDVAVAGCLQKRCVEVVNHQEDLILLPTKPLDKGTYLRIVNTDAHFKFIASFHSIAEMVQDAVSPLLECFYFHTFFWHTY